MAKKELEEQLESYEENINNIPLIIDPCKMCKTYKKNKGYDMGHYDKKRDEWVPGNCNACSWFYDSKFEVSV